MHHWPIRPCRAGRRPARPGMNALVQTATGHAARAARWFRRARSTPAGPGPRAGIPRRWLLAPDGQDPAPAGIEAEAAQPAGRSTELTGVRRLEAGRTVVPGGHRPPLGRVAAAVDVDD